MRKTIANLVTLIAISSTAWAADTPDERAAALAPHVELSMPETAAPHPLAILMPGCLGWHPHHDRWRDELLSRGFAVLHVDSFGARGFGDRAVMEREICTGRQIPGFERAGDLMAVLAEIWARPEVQADQTVLMGWSHGGWSGMDFMTLAETARTPPNLSTMPDLELSNIVAAFFFYPYCGFGSLTGEDGFPQSVKTVIFHGTADVITDPRECRARAEALAAAGADVEFVSLRNAGHWFDNHSEPTTYDSGAAAQTQSVIDSVLEELAIGAND